VAREPRGDLFGAAYCEVPYVDALATASEPALPLTEYEYLEFGNPRRNIADLETLLRNGPVTALGAEGAPGVFVVCRTGTADQHVYAYESGKWVLALRGERGPAPPAQAKLLAIDVKGGHFVKGSERLIQYTEDFLLLSKKCLE
jgi:oligopeptidase B